MYAFIVWLSIMCSKSCYYLLLVDKIDRYASHQPPVGRQNSLFKEKLNVNIKAQFIRYIMIDVINLLRLTEY